MDRLRPGDHACHSFASDEDRWQALRAFALNGFACGEKVICFVDGRTAQSDAVDQICGTSALARSAENRGQLVVYSSARWYAPDSRFEAERTISQTLDAIDEACRDGYTGLRGTGDMAWVLRPGMDPSVLIDYERAAHRELFGDRRYTGLCQYDRRRFSEPLTAAMKRIHPVTLIEGAGALHVTVTDDGLRLAGDCDLVTRDELAAALSQARQRTAGQLVLDLTDLSFLDSRCATDILGLAAGMRGEQRLEVRCGRYLHRILALLGAGSIPHLVVTRDEPRLPDPWPDRP